MKLKNVPELKKLRAAVDRLDDKTAALLAKRFGFAEKIGRLKKKCGCAVGDAKREREILERLASYGGRKYADGLVRVFKAVIRESRGMQKVRRKS